MRTVHLLLLSIAQLDNVSNMGPLKLAKLDKVVNFFMELLYNSSLCHSNSLHKVLFTEQPETYYKWDNWPPESDRK